MRVARALVPICVGSVFALAPAWAQTAVGTAFTYQGRLTDNGTPANGLYDLQFALFTASAGGSQVGAIVTKEDVTVTNGLFAVSLDFGAAAFAGEARFLEVGARPGASTGAFTLLTPRQELTPAPNAVFSQNTPWTGIGGMPAGFADGVDNDLLGGLSCANGQVAKWNGTAWVCTAQGDHDHLAQNWVGDVDRGLGVFNSRAGGGGVMGASWATSGQGWGVSGGSNSPEGSGVLGFASATNGTATGVAGESLSTSGRGVVGQATAGTGITSGVWGQSDSIAGRGVYGTATATTGTTYGIWGENNSTDGAGVYGRAAALTGVARGVLGQSDSTAGRGVSGLATATTGAPYGVFGQSESPSGVGVYGRTSSTSGVNYGVVGSTPSTDGRGVWGSATASVGSAWGVFGQSASTLGIGVYGFASPTSGETYGVHGRSNSTQGRGVYGRAAATSGPASGVYGESASAAGFGGYFTNSGGGPALGVGSTGILFSDGTTQTTAGAPSNHTHLGQTWSGAGTLGLSVSSNQVSGSIGISGAGYFGLRGVSDATGGRGVYGTATATTGTTYGVYGESASSGGAGVYGASTGTASAGVYGASPSVGVDGLAYGGGEVNGVRGVAWSAAGRGVYGSAPSSGVWGESGFDTGRGVTGRATATTGTTYGVYGESASTAGRGVYGRGSATAGNTYGVYGETFSPDGKAVFGNATGGTGVTEGVRGQSASPAGRGVYGYAGAATGFTYGVVGESTSNNGSGVSGRALGGGGGAGVVGQSTSTSGYGVYGSASAPTGTTYGVYGYAASPAGYAGYFVGPVQVTGWLSKPAGSFKIDHPLDPENKYLYHSFVESPDMKNIYDGVVVLDDRGQAVVELPAWFEALNRDFRYQLTAIGAPGPGLHIARKIRDGSFLIGGGSPGMEVSWQVTGIRKDAFAEKHRIPVEEDKPEAERGLLLHPEEHGQPKEKGLDYQRDKDLLERPAVRTPPEPRLEGAPVSGEGR